MNRVQILLKTSETIFDQYKIDNKSRRNNGRTL